MPFAATPLDGSTAASIGMPMSTPFKLTSAPPLLPGLEDALVWMRPDNRSW
jgi:hypothetical protein